jgi:hypothetical protein
MFVMNSTWINANADNANQSSCEIAVKKLLDEALDEIAISIWEQSPNPNIRNCVQIGRLVKNEPYTEIAIADEIQNLKEYGAPQSTRSTDLRIAS